MRKMWNFGRADFGLFRQTLAEVDWENIFQLQNLDDICQSFSENVLSAADFTIPNKLVTV